MKYVVVDLDGTVFDCSHRVDYAKAKLWDEFHSRLAGDTPFPDLVLFLQTTTLNVLAVTGRSEPYRLQTLAKINECGLPIEDLLMRPEFNFQSDAEMKLSLLEEYFGSKEEVLANVAFCLDDRDRVVEGFRNYGLSCWQVRTGEY